MLRLKADGYEIEEDKRQYKINLSLENVRNTQLYRTLLHEIGHYYHYITTESDIYEKLTKTEKETFAHDFADKLRKELKDIGVIPFDRILTRENIERLGLDVFDFEDVTPSV